MRSVTILHPWRVRGIRPPDPPKGDGIVKLGLARETYPGERRVAIVPAALRHLKNLGIELLIEPGAGLAAGFSDEDYKAAGASVLASRDEVFRDADAIVQTRVAGANPEAAESDLSLVREGQILIGSANALTAPNALVPWIERKATIFALELMPRITRAQSMDILSAMATIAGYRAVIMAAAQSTQLFPLLMTAAGTLKPAKVFVIGAGVAGLQAIATAKRLGASVSACDVRPAVKEQVESVGGAFVELPGGSGEGKGGYAREMGEDVLKRQQETLRPVIAESNVVICTAAIPGKAAPVLVTQEAVEVMNAGAVIIDLAAESGGNCALTKAGETIQHGGVTICGPTNIASDAPRAASEMFSNNVVAFLKVLVKDGNIVFNLQDECLSGTLLCKDGNVRHPAVREALGSLIPEVAPAAEAPPPDGSYRLKVD
jgi:NAD(P) transhydrogenase subunit alpha